MQIRIYNIPIDGGETIVEEMNGFLRSHKVIELKKELLTTSVGTFWSFCITYLISGNGMVERKEKVDYKQILDEETFARFSKMRSVRKQLAEEDAVPAYSVFTDAELAEFAKQPNLSVLTMKKVEGVGEKRMEKYGKKLVELVLSKNETSGIFNGADSRQEEPLQSLF